SLAMTYAELRLGRSPFPHNDMMSLMLAHLKDPPELEPLPESEQKVLLKALHKVPTERYGNCREFIRALEQAVQPGLRRIHPELFPTPESISPERSSGGEGDPWGTVVATDPSNRSGVPVWHSGGKTPSYPDTLVQEPRQVPWMPLLLGLAAILGVVVFIAW